MNSVTVEETLDTRAGTQARGTRPSHVAALVTAGLLTALLLGRSAQGEPDLPPSPPIPPGHTATLPERVADRFVAAYLDFDRGRALSYLAPGADLDFGNVLGGADWWQRVNRYEQATGLHVVGVDPCRELRQTNAGTEVTCQFVAHQLGSGALGRGPFGDNVVSVTVRRGRIVNADRYSSTILSGFEDEVRAPFEAWVADTHPSDRHLLAAWQVPDADPETVGRSLARWRVLSKEYVTAVQAGEAR